MKSIETLLTFVAVVAWLAGVVIAKGFWLTAAAIFIPFYAWYLVIERAMLVWGML